MLVKSRGVLMVGVLAVGSLFVCGAAETELKIYTWADYFDREVLARFEKAHHCRIVVDTFDSNEAMYEKLLAGSSGYDVVTPSTYQIQAMIDKKMVAPLDHGKLPHVSRNFDKVYAGCIFDPSFEYSVPYVVNYAGLVYRKDKVTGTVDSWRVYENPDYQGNLSILDDPRETIGIALLALGCSINTTNRAEIAKATALLLKWRANSVRFDNERYKSAVAGGDLAIGHGYFSDCLQIAIRDRGHITFVFPKEGFSISADEFVLAADSAKSDLAHAFIDFMYEEKNARDNMISVCATMPVAPAIRGLDKDLKDLICVDAAVLKRGEVIRDFDDKPEVRKMYSEAWDKVKAGK